MPDSQRGVHRHVQNLNSHVDACLIEALDCLVQLLLHVCR